MPVAAATSPAQSRSNSQTRIIDGISSDASSSSSSSSTFQESEKEISNFHYNSLLEVTFVDFFFWVVMFWRDYASSLHHMTVSHYIGVHPPLDLAILLFTPLHLLHWFEVFRFLETVQCFALVLQLWWFEIDGPSPVVTQLRFLVCVLRGLHSLVNTGRYVSTSDHASFFDFVYHRLLLQPRNNNVVQNQNQNQQHQHQGELVPLQYEFGLLFSHLKKVSAPSPASDFLTAIAFVLFANFFSSTHNPFVEKAIGPLTQFQAGDSLTLFFKLFVFDRLIGNYRNRAITYFILFSSLMCQWFMPGMLIMYSGAPYPFLHIGAEIGLFLSTIQRILRINC